MSMMISSLIDELLELALWLDDEFYDAEATKVRDAADTILQFRDDLLRANVENAKLRELVKRMFDRVNYECRCCSVFCSDWDEDNECCVFATLMRELGIEADG